MKVALILACLLWSSNAARILGIVPIPSYSHQIPYRALFRELSLRGHQVTLITTNPQNNPTLTNLTEIDLSSTYTLLSKVNVTEIASQSYITLTKVRVYIYNKLMEHILTNSEVTKLIQNKSEHFDLAMVEIFNPTNYAFAYHFGCPFIGMTSSNANSRNYKILGNPIHPVLYPDVVSPIRSLSFWNRLEMIIIDLIENFSYNYMIVPEQQRIIEKQFGKSFPSLLEIEKNMSLLYVNTDLVLQTRRPLLPNVIRMGGGLHINPLKPLPKKFQDFLDAALQGAIYFSLGSNVKSKDLPDKIKKIMLDTFSELPYQVLWKFEEDSILKTPKNVMTSKWIPQQDVLRHPNVVLFITQGGLQSTEEAIHSFVPMLVIPFMRDQPRNAKIISEKGMGLTLDYKKLTKESLINAILRITKNSNYRKQVEKISRLIKDEPMTGLERAIWWAEFVIRHRGASHLRRKEIPSYQYYLLDVIAFCLTIVGAALFFVIKTLKFAVSTLKTVIIKKKLKSQ